MSYSSAALLLFLTASTLFAQNSDEFRDAQMQGFQNQINEFESYKSSVEDEFESYQKAIEGVYKTYARELGAYWEEPELSSKKRWVSYSKDKMTVSKVDFEKEEITLQSIASSKEEAEERLRDALKTVVTTDTQKAQQEDPLEGMLKEVAPPPSLVTDTVEREPILASVIFEEKEPPKEKVDSYVENKIRYTPIEVKESPKVKGARVYTLNVKLPSDSMIKRSKLYYDEVRRHSKRQEIPLELIFAIMHSESSFNPRARSHVPAYGLMQIVPQTAGIDTYLFLYDEKRLVSAEYLYNTKNNITMGSAYLHILYYKYLSKIKDPQSRLYCTIAAYNTGAGNVARTFVGTNDTAKAALVINDMSSEEVYRRLIKDLKYDETREYLKKVTQRMASYKKVYG